MTFKYLSCRKHLISHILFDFSSSYLIFEILRFYFLLLRIQLTGHDKGKTTMDDTGVLLTDDATFCCIPDNLRMNYHSYLVVFFRLHLARRRVCNTYLTFVAALVDPVYQGCGNQVCSSISNIRSAGGVPSAGSHLDYTVYPDLIYGTFLLYLQILFDSFLLDLHSLYNYLMLSGGLFLIL